MGSGKFRLAKSLTSWPNLYGLTRFDEVASRYIEQKNHRFDKAVVLQILGGRKRLT